MYEELRNKTGKQYVKKLQFGGGIDFSNSLTSPVNEIIPGVYKSQITGQLVGDPDVGTTWVPTVKNEEDITGGPAANSAGVMGKLSLAKDILSSSPQYDQSLMQTGSNLGRSLAQYATQNGGSLKGAMSNGAVTGAIGAAANAGLDIIDDALMGDKSFDTQSQAIDDAVRQASQQLSKTGPWGLLAAGVLESANFIDKAVGKSVQGYEVGDVGSGYNSVDTQLDTLSYRGTQTGKMKRNLARRNEQMNMAMLANEVNEEEKFQMEARVSSINNVLQANQIALAGGIDTSLLGG